MAEESENRQSIRKFIIELMITLGIALAISILLGFCYGKISWTVSGILVVLAALMVCVPRLPSRPKKFSQKEIDKLNALAEKSRQKLIKRLGWHWEVRGISLCKLDNKTGKVIESIDQRELIEIWGINTDEGPYLEDFWILCICGFEREYSVASELLTNDIREWFFALAGFDHGAYIQCMGCTDNRKTLLWRQNPLSCNRNDAWVLTSLLLAKQKSVTLVHLMVVADWLNHLILNDDTVNHALSVLCTNGYLCVDGDDNILLTDHVKAIKDKSYKKAKPYDKIGIVHQYLIQHATVPCSGIHEYFTDDDMRNAYLEYTKGRRKR